VRRVIRASLGNRAKESIDPEKGFRFLILLIAYLLPCYWVRRQEFPLIICEIKEGTSASDLAYLANYLHFFHEFL